jgi:hypothetical protein
MSKRYEAKMKTWNIEIKLIQQNKNSKKSSL